MDCLYGIAKYVLCISNGLFCLLGITLIVTGSVHHGNTKTVIDVIPGDIQNVQNAPIFTIIIGCAILCIALMGFCGALRKSACLLLSFAIILLILFVIQICIAIFCFVIVKNSNAMEAALHREFKDLINNYNNPSRPSNPVLDPLHKKLECCGAKGPSDFPVGKVPKSCCKKGNNPSTCTLYKEGCVTKVVGTIRYGVHTVAGVIVLSAFVELISVIFAVFLSYSIKG